MRLLEEAVVVVHLKLRFDLAHSIERNTDHDKDRCTTERLDERIVGEEEEDRRHDCNDGDEDRTRQCNAAKYVLDVLHSIRTRADARNEAALLL